MEKECFKCNQLKPLEEFYKHKRMADGYLGKCKECTKNDVQERYDKHPDIIKAYERKRWQDPKRRKRVIVYQRNGRRKNKLRTKAYNKERTEEFKIINPPQPCQLCDDSKSEKHHPDYSNPLIVEYLCKKDHLKLHGRKIWK